MEKTGQSLSKAKPLLGLGHSGAGGSGRAEVGRSFIQQVFPEHLTSGCQSYHSGVA